MTERILQSEMHVLPHRKILILLINQPAAPQLQCKIISDTNDIDMKKQFATQSYTCSTYLLLKLHY